MDNTGVSLSKLKEEIDQLDIDRVNKTAILNLIDMKVDSDMEKVLSRIDMLFGKFDTQLQSLKGELKTENQSLKNELKTENQSLKNEFKTENQGLKREIKIVYWVIGIAMAIIALMNALKS